ncbi:MAG TPA: glycosyltransferase family 1 protein [Bacteroidota bacterium]|nr:glycosyltransferase family 1 protein [Bacteroidota bacterium]
MKIAYFNANMRVGQDGVTRVMYKMLEAARSRGHEVLVFTSTLPDANETDIPMYKVTSVVLPFQKAYRLALPGYQRFARKLEEFQPDLLHINSPCTLGFGAVKYGRDFGIPVVATYHTHFPTYPRYYKLYGFEEIVWKLSKYLYNNVDRTLVPTIPILKELEEHGIRNLKYLPNGVDVSLFNPANRSQAWRERMTPEGKTVLLFVSRLVWEKDLKDLAAMYRILRSRRSDFEMVIVGDGYARREFEPMMPGARFLGYQFGKTLAESYASSDIFVFPSTTETFGLVTLEAMASGLVPVAAGYGGATGILRDGESGFLTAPHDPEHMASRIEWLLDHPAKREQVRRQALSRAAEFSWDRILNQLFESYSFVIRQRKSRQRSAA